MHIFVKHVWRHRESRNGRANWEPALRIFTSSKARTFTSKSISLTPHKNWINLDFSGEKQLFQDLRAHPCSRHPLVTLTKRRNRKGCHINLASELRSGTPGESNSIIIRSSWEMALECLEYLRVWQWLNADHIRETSHDTRNEKTTEHEKGGLRFE